MSAESQGSTGRRRVTCAQGAETYPSIFTRDDDGVASSGETRSEVVESEGRGGLRPPQREKELTSLDAIPDGAPSCTVPSHDDGQQQNAEERMGLPAQENDAKCDTPDMPVDSNAADHGVC